jgi:hypothetical protein
MGNKPPTTLITNVCYLTDPPGTAAGGIPDKIHRHQFQKPPKVCTGWRLVIRYIFVANDLDLWESSKFGLSKFKYTPGKLDWTVSYPTGLYEWQQGKSESTMEG